MQSHTTRQESVPGSGRQTFHSVAQAPLIDASKQSLQAVSSAAVVPVVQIGQASIEQALAA